MTLDNKDIKFITLQIVPFFIIIQRRRCGDKSDVKATVFIFKESSNIKITVFHNVYARKHG